MVLQLQKLVSWQRFLTSTFSAVAVTVTMTITLVATPANKH